MNRSSEASNDIFIGVCAAVLSLVVLREASNLPPAFYDPLGPAGLVIATAAAIVVLSVLLILRGVLILRGTPVKAAEIARAAASAWPALLIAVVLLAYLAILELRLFGFRESTLALFLVTSLVFKTPRRQDLTFRYIVPLLGVGILVSYGAYWLFTEIFIVNLPR